MLCEDAEILLSFIKENQESFNQWIDKKTLFSLENLLVLGLPVKRLFALYDELLTDGFIIEHEQADKLKLSTKSMELLRGDLLIMKRALSG